MKRAISTMGAVLAATAALGVGLAEAQPKDAERHGWHHADRGGHGDRGYGGHRGRLDVDGDGTISREEFENPAAARFAAMDADGDGAVTAEEMAAYAEAQREARRIARAERMVARLDSDGDGAVSLEEMDTRLDRAAIFDEIDSDGDGALSDEEMREAREIMRDRMGRRGPFGDD